jgi:hypothetical protein
MSLRRLIALSLAAAAAVPLPAARAVAADPPAAPRVFLLDGERLQEGRRRARDGDPRVQVALRDLLRNADRALEEGPFSVMHKTLTPPSGDKHDYISFGPYWWPDPDQPDGLPYIRKDGETNPESRTTASDRVPLGRMISAVETLAQGYFFTGEERYAAHAAVLLRAWFLDEATRMNPHLRFGQAIPGRTEGRGIGIIDTRGLTDVVDAVGLLAGSQAWTAADQRGLLAWFDAYLDWLLTSPHGTDEDETRNNHATWYDVQVMSFALFAGRDDVARRVARAAAGRRIATQIEADGRQPHELARTKSFDYSVMNLAGMFELAALAARLDVDLWGFRTPEGAGLQGALDYLEVHTRTDREWPYPQFGRVRRSQLLPLLWRADRVYGGPRYAEAIAGLDAEATAEHAYKLLWP